MKILVTTYPFTETDLFLSCFETVYNPFKRKMGRSELMELLKLHNPDIIIAGTEKYDSEVLDFCTNLKLISRVGTGLDSVDLNECHARKIDVTNTPDAQTKAVAELTVGEMLMACRNLFNVISDLRQCGWNRHIGLDLSECTIGIIGYGRIGSEVARLLRPFGCKILVNDIHENRTSIASENGFIPVEKTTIYQECDIITIHVPSTELTNNMLDQQQLDNCNAKIIINNSRGGIINEQAAYHWLKANPDKCIVIDAFEEEPYKGDLLELKNAILTPHIGSCTKEARYRMERDSITNVRKFLIDFVK